MMCMHESRVLSAQMFSRAFSKKRTVLQVHAHNPFSLISTSTLSAAKSTELRKWAVPLASLSSKPAHSTAMPSNAGDHTWTRVLPEMPIPAACLSNPQPRQPYRLHTAPQPPNSTMKNKRLWHLPISVLPVPHCRQRRDASTW